MSLCHNWSAYPKCTRHFVVFLVDEIADLRERIVNMEEVQSSEKTSYEQQLQQLQDEYKETRDQLIADNMMKG